MAQGYFQRVHSETATRFWVNNPTAADMGRAIAAGAVNCTTNPSYCAKLLQSEPGYVRGVIDRLVRDDEDNAAIAEQVYVQTAQRLMVAFEPLYKASSGQQGYVTVQDDPRRDDDADAVVRASLRAQTAGKNFMAKIPVTPAGMEAIAELLKRDVPICATEVFAVDQAIRACELYRRVIRLTGKTPPFYVTHITGIFDQYLSETARSEGIAIAPAVLAQAGTAIARKQYRIMQERGYEAKMLGGGARGLHHFADFVGGRIHITINWSTAEELIARDEPVTPRMDMATPQEVVAEVSAKLPCFGRAYEEGGLPENEFADFGPLVFFRTMFLNGYARLLDEVAERRTRAR
jgi:transaldolase